MDRRARARGIAPLVAALLASACTHRAPLKIGLVVGFAAGVPMNLGHGTFQALAPAFWVGWGLEMGVGAILAGLAAGWIYRD